MEDEIRQYKEKKDYTAYIVVGVVLVILIGITLYQRKDKMGEQTTATSTAPILCENMMLAVRITEVSASSTPEFTIGKGIVLEPAGEAEKEIPVSIPKPMKVGSVVKQCINIVVE